MSRRWSIAPGERLYAVGDIHGRADLLQELLAIIRKDGAERSAASTRLIILGDFVDRGPDAAEVSRRLLRYASATDRFIVLKGNHEQGMVDALEGDFTTLRSWLSCGGRETLLSWGVPTEALESEAPSQVVAAARAHVPREVLQWVKQLPTSWVSGDVLFVHAGIRPGVPLQRQQLADLLWITDEFTASEEPHAHLVVHGHSISEGGPDIRPNRIGIDTGAYRSGRLTAIGLQGADRWFLNT